VADRLPAAGRSTELLSGWGGTSPTAAEVAVTPDEPTIRAAMAASGPRGAIARGLGRSYGDAAQNGGGTVLALAGDRPRIELDEVAGTATVWGGTSIDDLLRVIVPRGYFVPVTPGTRSVTIGGAIAADIHGKNHHVDGSFANHVTNLWLLLGDGAVHEVGPNQRPGLFWATVGGMGLTGVILRATVRLLPVDTSRLAVDTLRLADLDAVLAAMTEGDHRYRYSVAWIDPMASGTHLGRSVLTRGDHARVEALSGLAAAAPLAYDPHARLSIPPAVPPAGLINHATVRAFNEMWFRKSPRRRDGELQSIPTFFHPLDAVRSWNRVYGRHGFVQYQVVIPFGAESVLQTVVERFARSGAPSFLSVLKRFGAASPAPLSFPMPGWTLALDLPASRRGLSPLLGELDRLVLDAGGRHYLAKDAHTSPSSIRRGYPRLDEWRTERDKADPTGVWRSDLGRRLGLVD
jgi:decaprenylphospho-beta-D-ribofuranose 2-oxidase